MACRKLVKELPYLGKTGNKIIGAVSLVRNASSDSNLSTKIHTGQVFEKDDYRNVRFTNAKRYVNENWAIDLIDEIPPKEVTERVVHCDGGDGPLGHPRVYINLDQPGSHICVYCGLRFVKKDDHHHH